MQALLDVGINEGKVCVLKKCGADPDGPLAFLGGIEAERGLLLSSSGVTATDLMSLEGLTHAPLTGNCSLYYGAVGRH